MAKCGIGLAVRLAANGMFQIDDVTPNSPSQMCGYFKKGDLITAVDGKSVIGHTMDQFVQAVLGAPGSDITVTNAVFKFVPALLYSCPSIGCNSAQKSRRFIRRS
jgi:C-terminal processing protease CtpA/Prc